jgi:hypothetical protein
VLLLSVATVCVAWSGYQAAKWSGVQAQRYAAASTARAEATRAATLAGQERLQDLLNFNRWLEVSSQGNELLAALYERRFREEFRPAFEAWRASDPVDNPEAVATPLLEPEYRLANFERADELEREGDRRFEAAHDATENADKYVFSTVFFAAVLFFAGISMRFVWVRMRITILALAFAFLVYGIATLLTLEPL